MTLFANRYAIEGLLGEGTLGHAVRAVDRLTDDIVAIKILRRQSEASVFMDEFSALTACRHPSLVRARDFGWGEWEGQRRPFHVTELVDGPELGAWWPNASWQERRDALIDVLRALGALHRSGRRHGDVKADNVRIADGHAVLLDLSCVAAMGPATHISGTPGYLAPELMEGRGADGRADLYALGVTLGRLGVPDALEPLVTRLVAATPSERPADVTEVLEALDADVEPPALGAAPWLGGALLEEALDALLARVVRREAGPRTLAIVGPTGAGKTRALQELKWRAQQRVRTVEARADRGLGEAFGRALSRPVGPGMEALETAARVLAAREEPCLVLLDDATDARFVELLDAQGSLAYLYTCETAERGPHVTLAPLEPDAIQRWAEATGVAHVHAQELHVLTGGRPAAIAERLARAARGEDWRAESQTALLEHAPRDERHAVAVVGWLGEARLSDVVQIGVPAAAVYGAAARAWLVERDGRWRAERRVGMDASLRPFAERALAHVDGPRRAALLLAMDRTAEARDCASAWRSDPRAWLDVLAALDPAEAARAAVAAGDLARADALLAQLDEDPAPLARAELALKRARPDETLDALDGIEGADAADLRARALLAKARYEEARAEARRAGAKDANEAVARRLRETEALAAGYLGESSSDAALSAVAVEHRAAGDVAGAHRVTSYRGILAFLRGDWAGAAERYEAALARAREGALDDALAVDWMNLGTARQQAGDWGGALEAYELGARLAALLAQGGTEASLRFNLANLAVEIGHVTRAHALAQSARERAEALGFSHLALPLARLGVELAWIDGRLGEGRAAARAAREQAEASGAERERDELDLLAAEIALADGILDEAAELARRVSERDSDLGVRARVIAARIALARADTSAAMREGERALRAAKEHDLTLLGAEAHAVLARAYAEQHELSAQHRAAARRAWQRVEATLPTSYREALFTHPRRRGLKAASARPTPEAPDATRRLRRLLEINRRLSASLDVNDVLERAMDAAIELSQAERGFVLLREGEALEVAAARNVDRETLPESHLKFSRSIAERVIESGTPVITVDAQRDERFATERSVHAMRLQSVACVPIGGPDGARGALYLDNRFERGRFAEDDLSLLDAFANQVAIALRNAELHAALEARTAALDAARAALEDRVRGQAERIETLSSELRQRQRALEYRYDYSRIVGRGARMRALLDTLERVIDTDLSVLIRGESGTGKELVAKSIHFNGPRRDAPMVSLNCAALPATLIESELFGHVRGAFTGADQSRDGLFVQAAGGTVFLDELGEMPLPMQAKLLRALQEKEVRPVGAAAPVKIDVRVLAATNRDLAQQVREGAFREDLYYRIGVVELELPALRERPEDLPPLCDHFLSELGDKKLRSDALALLRAHAWPGNVRELSNVLARAHALSDSSTIGADDLGLTPEGPPMPVSRSEYAQTEAARIQRALVEHRWNVSAVSRALGIPRQTLYRRIASLGLARPRRTH